jgi:RHS repeat-associated protein
VNAVGEKEEQKMKNRMLQIAVVLGLMAGTLSAQAGKLPEFMNAQQLTAWRTQHAAPAVGATQAPDEQISFFTGKPYDAASGTYLFKYRAYSPTLARWTSTDPSGFPDGANNSNYAPTPNFQLDTFGLWKIELEGHPDSGGAQTVFNPNPVEISSSWGGRATYYGFSSGSVIDDTSATVSTMINGVAKANVLDLFPNIVDVSYGINIALTGNHTLRATYNAGIYATTQGAAGWGINYVFDNNNTTEVTVTVNVTLALNATSVTGGGPYSVSWTGTTYPTSLNAGTFVFKAVE